MLADAQDFELPEPADAAICTSDSLNHITDPIAIASTFACVRRALREGGLFVFDLNTEAKYRIRWAGSFGIVEDDHACVVRCTFEPLTRLARFDATTFLRHDASPDQGPSPGQDASQGQNASQRWKRDDLSIEERFYPKPRSRLPSGNTGLATSRSSTGNGTWIRRASQRNSSSYVGQYERRGTGSTCKRPLLAIDLATRAPTSDPAIWNLGWTVRNLDSQPLRNLAGWLPHGRFRSPRRTLNPVVEVGPASKRHWNSPCRPGGTGDGGGELLHHPERRVERRGVADLRAHHRQVRPHWSA